MSVTTAVDLVAKVKGLIPPDRNPVEATCWYISYRRAEMIWELSTRDLAEMIRDGDNLGGPVKNIIDITGWLDEGREDRNPEEVEAFERWLDEDVRKFFNPDHLQSVGSRKMGGD